MNRLVASAALVFAGLAGAREPGAMIEWPHVGSEPAHTKYSAVDEITAANVGELEIVWTWEPNEMPLEEYGTRPGPFQATPIMVDNVLYLSTMYTRVAALDAGETAWKVPFGEGSPDVREHPLLRGVELPERLGTSGNSGPMVIGGGLVFVGGGAPYLYAFDKATGAEVWRGATTFRAHANPMTYRARSGRQFIVIATGGGSDAALVAFARAR